MLVTKSFLMVLASLMVLSRIISLSCFKFKNITYPKKIDPFDLLVFPFWSISHVHKRFAFYFQVLWASEYYSHPIRPEATGDVEARNAPSQDGKQLETGLGMNRFGSFPEFSMLVLNDVTLGASSN